VGEKKNTMNSTKYRKFVLTENYQDNAFIMITLKVNIPRCFSCPFSVNFQRSHPKVISEEAFWIGHNKLCVGYHSRVNPVIFWPVFSWKRQKLLDIVQYDKKNSIIHPNLKYARRKYVTGLDQRFRIPMDCVEIILSFIHHNM